MNTDIVVPVLFAVAGILGIVPVDNRFAWGFVLVGAILWAAKGHI